MENTRGIYVVEAYGGRIGLIRATSLANARRQALRSEGTSNVDRVRKASAEDISHVQAMGGYVPRPD